MTEIKWRKISEGNEVWDVIAGELSLSLSFPVEMKKQAEDYAAKVANGQINLNEERYVQESKREIY